MRMIGRVHCVILRGKEMYKDALLTVKNLIALKRGAYDNARPKTHFQDRRIRTQTTLYQWFFTKKTS